MGVTLDEMRDVDGGNFVDKIDAGGITDEELVKLLASELKAVEQKVFHKGEGEQGLVYSKPMVAHETRLRALDMALRLKNRYPAERKQVQIEGGLPIIPLTEDQQLELQAMKEVLKKRAKKV
jgi:hypothetical protein